MLNASNIETIYGRVVIDHFVYIAAQLFLVGFPFPADAIARGILMAYGETPCSCEVKLLVQLLCGPGYFGINQVRFSIAISIQRLARAQQGDNDE